MKIKQETAVAFLLALGFKAAEEWDKEKLESRLAEVPGRLTIDAVPSKMHEIYDELAEAVKAKHAIEVTTAKEEEPAPKAKGKSTKTPKPPKAPKAKKEPKVKKEKERDAFGSIVGTTRSSINAVLNKEWQSDEEIAKAAKVTVRQARLHCRRLTRQGAMEKMRRIAYRLVTKKAA